MRYLLMAVMVMAAATVEARLGETEEQLEKRYGKPVYKGDYSTLYAVTGGYMVSVTFEGGLSVSERYSKDQNGRPSPISKDESAAIMRKLYSEPCDCHSSFERGFLTVTDKSWSKKEYDKTMKEIDDAVKADEKKADKAVSGF